MLIFSSCSLSPLASRKTPVKNQKVYSVYVCGAVQNEGFVDVPEGSDYAFLLEKAGVLSVTYYPTNILIIVTPRTKMLAVNYFDGEKSCYCVNVNGSAVTYRLDVENVDSSVIDILADYIERHGKIRNKATLRTVLGDEIYQSNFYKFYIDISDYEHEGEPK